MKVSVAQDIEVPDELVDAVTDALLRNHWWVFEGQWDRIDKTLARKVAASAVAAVIQHQEAS